MVKRLSRIHKGKRYYDFGMEDFREWPREDFRWRRGKYFGPLNGVPEITEVPFEEMVNAGNNLLEAFETFGSMALAVNEVCGEMIKKEVKSLNKKEVRID